MTTRDPARPGSPEALAVELAPLIAGDVTDEDAPKVDAIISSIAGGTAETWGDALVQLVAAHGDASVFAAGDWTAQRRHVLASRIMSATASVIRLVEKRGLAMRPKALAAWGMVKGGRPEPGALPDISALAAEYRERVAAADRGKGDPEPKDVAAIDGLWAQIVGASGLRYGDVLAKLRLALDQAERVEGAKRDGSQATRMIASAIGDLERIVQPA